MKKALNFNIVIRPIKNKEHKVAGGLQLSEDLDTDLRYLTGEIISVGSRVIKEMKDEPIKIEVGDIVDYDRHAGHEIRWTDDKPLKILKLGDLVAIHKNE
jgi:co-chaperonin GroES (HSP10)